MRLEDVLRLTADSYGIVPLWLARAAVVMFGLLWGSFLNVVIYRVPREMSVVSPPSHCPGCEKPIAPYDNIPVLTWVLLRGRARCCGIRVSPRYPLVELLGGLLSLAVFEVAILALPGSTPFFRAAAIYAAEFSLCLGLVAAAFIDAEHMFLPDSITIGGAIVGVVTASLRGMPIVDALAGVAAGFLGVWFPFIFLYKGLLGRTGMGLGDAKLLALAGAWFGWPGALFALLAGAVQGSVYAGIAKLAGASSKLPDAVLADIAELEAAAANGDEEAKKALAEDPLTEDESNPFLVRFFQRLAGVKPTPVEPPAVVAAEPPGSPGSPEADVEIPVPRARIPFGPFLILSILELLFAGEWLRAHFFAALWPID